MTVNVLRLAGYQGSDSILTTSLQVAATQLRQSLPEWLVTLEDNVTTKSETARSLFTSIDSGVRHMGYMASGYLVAQVPELALLDMPFAVRDRAQALDRLDGAVGQWLAACIEQRTGYKLLGWWDNGFRHLSNRVRPITSAADCAGLKIRTLDSAVYRQSLEALGFRAFSIDIKDFPAALKEGQVDAQENPLVNYALFSVDRYHRYVSLTSHFFGLLLFVCHRPWFDQLSKAQQAHVMAASQAATQRQRELALAEDDLLHTSLKERGVQIVEASQIDIISMINATAGVRLSVQQHLPAEQVAAYINVNRA